MESETLRPIQYPNPFMKVPPPILEDQEESVNDPSTLSSLNLSKVTMSSSNPSKEDKRSKSKKNDKPDGVPAASSGSSKSKKLWKGWKKTLGKVKSIVQDIDEKRIPAPVMTQVQLKSPNKKKASE
jgi:hypothetical protein